MENKNVDLIMDDNLFYIHSHKKNYPVTENPESTIKLVQSISTDKQLNVIYRYKITKNVIKEIIKK